MDLAVALRIRDVVQRLLVAFEISIDQMQVYLRQYRDAERNDDVPKNTLRPS